jgi:2-dehydro-3-deoxyphosphogluconate aldolase / (4S)-4-hydroxy-2-oxoglutarate aldolase
MTPHHASEATLTLCRMAPVIPVLVIRDPAHAAPLARALVAGGLPVLEVTLRTPAALEVIAEMGRIPGAVVGAGTVLSPADVRAVIAAGAGFAVSPGSTDRLLSACEAQGLPILPGAATASEAMALLERGYTTQKFFPAEVAGGAAALRALSSPLPQITFCPTGGIGPGNAAQYLSLPNVICVGGSWVAPGDLIAAGDWDGVEALARAAASLPRSV